MTDSTRVPLVDGARPPTEDPQVAKTPGDSLPAPTPGGQARFIGAAMKTLFESSDVSIKRGDETRVMSRAQEALQTLHSRYPNSNPPSAEDVRNESTSSSHSSSPPRPRVDAVLWIVLAVGLFAIAGWMIAVAL